MLSINGKTRPRRSTDLFVVEIGIIPGKKEIIQMKRCESRHGDVRRQLAPPGSGGRVLGGCQGPGRDLAGSCAPEVLASAARLSYTRLAAFGERRWSSAAMLKRPFRWIALFVCTTSCGPSVGSATTGVDAQGCADGADGDGAGDRMGRV